LTKGGDACGVTQTILVDAGNGPAHVRRIRTALDRIAVLPLRFVIYTHHHRTTCLAHSSSVCQ
jgi:glyoxylase-like metal-dependent hydrolase (beta-lactamase superfamily II)